LLPLSALLNRPQSTSGLKENIRHRTAGENGKLIPQREEQRELLDEKQLLLISAKRTDWTVQSSHPPTHAIT
jgi:hypothetical protein